MPFIEQKMSEDSQMLCPALGDQDRVRERQPCNTKKAQHWVQKRQTTEEMSLHPRDGEAILS